MILDYPNKKKVVLFLIILLIAILLAVAAGSYFYIQKEISIPLNSSKINKKEFIIQSGESVKQIAANLENEGLINSKDFFEIYVWQKKLTAKLQAGSYDLSSAMTIPEIVNLFIGGKIKENEIWITIPEGFSNKEIDKRLAESGLIRAGEFINFDASKSLNLSKNYEFLKDKPRNGGFQGYYFPDTYKYYKNSSLEDIAGKILDNFDKKLTKELREEIKKQNKSIFEVVILASIIEKEAGYSEDMKKIAGVFQNRINTNQLLQSDATVSYITGSNRTQSTYEDLQIDSLYNTYKYAGLPPGPISNPGMEAIKAAIYPEKTDYFYFLTKKDGKAVFSRTHEEHLINKSKYLQ